MQLFTNEVGFRMDVIQLVVNKLVNYRCEDFNLYLASGGTSVFNVPDNCKETKEIC